MAGNRYAMMMHEPSGKRMQECWPRPRTKGESLRSANKDVGRRARKETTDLPRRISDSAVWHDRDSTFNTYEDLDLAESDRLMSKRRPASTKISILEKTLTTQPTDAAAAITDGSACQSSGTEGSMCYKTTYREMTSQIEIYFAGFFQRHWGIQNAVVIARKVTQGEEWSQMMIERIREEARTDHLSTGD
ncbi:hypothetical protein B0H13DRAFT_1899419 [Mycena leptocephala]|nr:hypothetical protein B0H13DRAFT_1899419 [Mycena leptocephala]